MFTSHFSSPFLCDKDFSFLLAEMMTKFNQEMYAHIKVKKNKPLSSIGQRRVRVIQKETTENGSFSPAPKEVRVALPIASPEEITPHPKK